MCDASAGTDDSDRDSVARHVAPYVALIAVDHDREPNFVVCRVEAVAVRVAGEHDIDAGLVEDRQEQIPEVVAAVPRSAVERNMEEDDACRGVAEGFGGHRPAEPFALFAAIGVVVGKPSVFDVRVRLVFAAVEQQETDRSDFAELVVAAVTRREIVVQTVGEDAARLMVAAVVEYRGLRGVKVYRGVDEIPEQLLLIFNAAGHVAVEHYEVVFAEIDFPAQFGHVVGASVDVVQDDERTVGSRCRECRNRNGARL